MTGTVDVTLEPVRESYSPTMALLRTDEFADPPGPLGFTNSRPTSLPKSQSRGTELRDPWMWW